MSQATIMNVLGKIPFKQCTLEEVNAGVTRGIRAAQAVHALNDKNKDSAWRNELEDLTSRLSGRPTGDEAAAVFTGLKSSVDATAQAYQQQIDAAREALKESWLSPLERTHLDEKIQVLTGELSEVHRDSRVRLNIAEGRAKDAKELDKLRPRWKLLKERAKAVETALAVRI